MPQLRIKSGHRKGKALKITTDSVKIGRDSSCGMQILESGVSREHAEVYRVGEMYFIRDLGSRNGTSVNDLRIEDELLRDGDLIQISNATIVFEGTRESSGEEDAAEESFYQSESDPGKTLTMRVSPASGSGPVSEKVNIALSRLKNIAAKATEMKTIFDESLDILSLGIDTQEAFVFTLDNEGKLHLRGHKLKKECKRGKASKSIVQRALMEKRTIITANAKEDFRFRGEDSIALKGVSSVLCCPLLALGREHGVIYLANGPEMNPYSGDDAEFADLVATHLALMLATNEAYAKGIQVHFHSIHLLEHTVETLVPQLSGRGQRVAQMAKALGTHMGLKAKQISAIVSAAHLHHIGYLMVSRDVASTREFFEKDFSYVDTSVELLSGHGGFGDMAEIIRFHRSRLDGSGYPSVNIRDWSHESQILALSVELDLRVNLPLVFAGGDKPLETIVSEMLAERKCIVGETVMTAFEDAYNNGLILGG